MTGVPVVAKGTLIIHVFCAFAAGGDTVIKPVATLRHVALEPLHPGDQLGIVFKHAPVTGAVHVDGFVPITSGSVLTKDQVVVSTSGEEKMSQVISEKPVSCVPNVATVWQAL
jgi:hypothetical protein